MGKAMLLAVVVLVLFVLYNGDVLAGTLWCYAFAIPIGVAIGFIALALGWFK